jgi:beta-lactamase class A
MSDVLEPSDAARELAEAFDGSAAFYARNLSTGEEISYRPDAFMPTASTIKILVLAELFRQVDAGSMTLDAVSGMVSEDRRGGSGILKDLSTGLELPIRDYATLMIALSDNTATAVLVRLLGRERIVQSAREWGLEKTTFGFESRLDRTGDPRDYAASTPREIARLLELIASDSIVSPSACAQVRDILLTQQYHDQIGRYLPCSQYRRAEDPVVVRTKSGFMQGIRADAGIVDIHDRVRYVVCLMTEGSPDRSFSPEHPGAVLNGRISRLIFDSWWPDDVPTSG